ncbi:MAG: thiol-disulfide oxidoreductase DCC family protein [Rhodothermales bacterium]|nr:thiol-disulfide oxidoreductase DCC family protein [Rhodothermales bacterium]
MLAVQHTTDLTAPILLFDGVCNLCNRTVDFIVRHDTDGIVKFASLQSETGRALLDRAGLPGDYDASLVLVEDGRYTTESTAALRVARYLEAPWSWAHVLRIVPTFARDAVYRWISRNRYAWFGKRDTCRIPTAEERSRFLDDGAAVSQRDDIPQSVTPSTDPA